jgi:hypothetical protein
LLELTEWVTFKVLLQVFSAMQQSCFRSNAFSFMKPWSPEILIYPFCREVNEETIEAREKSSSLKQRRQMQAEKNREKLRLAFLKKQVEKLKSSAKGTPMQQSNS